MKYPRRIFVAVVGMTPQVVTETLYALLQAKGEAPTEIHLITTSNGRNRAVRDLLDSQTGQFHAFCRDFSLCGQIKFDASMIHVIHDAEGAEIPANRGQLALLVWNTAGRPEPAGAPAFADVTDPDMAKAAQWCTEQGTMGAKGDRFEPEGWTPKFKVIEVWNKAFPKQ